MYESDIDDIFLMDNSSGISRDIKTSEKKSSNSLLSFSKDNKKIGDTITGVRRGKKDELELEVFPKVQIKEVTVLGQLRILLRFMKLYCINFYYGLKGRLRSLFRFKIGIIDFIKSLLKLPFEVWSITRLDVKQE